MRSLAINLVLAYLKFWAQIALAIHRPTIIGIAGSVGKSSTKQALLAALQDSHKIAAPHGNSETGVPLGLLGLEIENYSLINWIKVLLSCPLHLFYLKSIDILILEMGTDDPYPPKNMEFLLGIVKPDIALWLNVYPVHTQQFSKTLQRLSPEERTTLTPELEADYILRQLALEDGKIISDSHCSLGIYHADDPHINNVILHTIQQQPLINLQRFGQNSDNTISYTKYEVTLEGATFGFKLSQQPEIELKISGDALPKEYREVFAATILAAQAVNQPVDQTINAIAKNLQLPPSRASLLNGIHNSTIIDSSYNASTSATLAFFELLHQLKDQTHRPITLLLGDMRELGDQAPAEHAKILQAIPGLADQVVAVGPLMQQYVIDPLQKSDNKPADIQWFKSSIEAGQYLKGHLADQTIILAKGSQNTIFLEEAVKLLLTNPEDTTQLCRQEDGWLKRKSLSLGAKKGTE